MGVDFGIDNWEKLGHDIPLLSKLPTSWRTFNGRFFSEPVVFQLVMQELMKNHKVT